MRGGTGETWACGLIVKHLPLLEWLLCHLLLGRVLTRPSLGPSFSLILALLASHKSSLLDQHIPVFPVYRKCVLPQLATEAKTRGIMLRNEDAPLGSNATKDGE